MEMERKQGEVSTEKHRWTVTSAGLHAYEEEVKASSRMLEQL